MNRWLYLLFPFAFLYDIATRFRNHLYNIGYKSSFEFETNLICVGNLSVGGTGKTPMVAYLIEKLKGQHKITTLSRGYKRKSKGFRIATKDDDAVSLGDEPFLFFKRYASQINVAVSEERAFAIPQILYELPETQVILMDDGFQHRQVVPSFSIVLSTYQRPFYEDYLLPMGRLREAGNNIKRASLVVITKCPIELQQEEMDNISTAIKAYDPAIKVFFTSLRYGKPQKIAGIGDLKERIISVAGIADTSAFSAHCNENYDVVSHFDYPDHHYFAKGEVDQWAEKAKANDASILMTEKDYVKLEKSILDEKISIFYQPVEQIFLREEEEFLESVNASIKPYDQNQ